MKKILISSLFLIGVATFSQTFEEKIAEKACDCVKNTMGMTNEKYQNCISTSMAETIAESGKQKENLKQINTTDGIKKTLKSVDEILQKTCLQSNDEAENPNYAYSTNEAATNAYIIGKDFLDEENYKLAIESFEIALKNDKNFVLALDDAAVCYRMLENFDKAIEYYKRSLKIYPVGDFALMNIGVIYTMKKDYKTANQYYQNLIDFQPKHPEGYYGMGKNQIELKEYESAMKNLIKAHKIYMEESSSYIEDTTALLELVYTELKASGKEELLKKTLKENGIEFDFTK